MKKKIMALCLVAVLAVTAIAGATLAYFTDSEKAENTFVLAKNIDVELREYQREKDENGQLAEKWTKYVDKTALYPVKYDNANRNNKIVTLFNKSNEAAYMRTIVLFEMNDKLDDKYANEGCAANCNCCPAGLHFSKTDVEAAAGRDNFRIHGCKNDILGEIVTIGEEKYIAVVFTDVSEKAIPAGEAQLSLMGVWMDKNITNETMKGWGEDGEVSILVLGQAIQANGLSHAEAMAELGVVNAANIATWYAEAVTE